MSKDDIYLWLVMSVRDPSKLEVAPMTQEIRLKWHNLSDLKRRYSLIEKSRTENIFNITRVEKAVAEPFFINFEVFISMKDSQEYEPPQYIILV
ncbi:MAG: hypothetical protein ACRD47_11545 [Nitrososphaeraceae archaeon]